MYLRTNTHALMQVHVEAARPPARPSTMRGALQLGVPPSGVLAELMGRATADADPPVTPVPYLVPLPMRHSLAVKRPDVMSEEAFGDLREDNLQLVIQVGLRERGCGDCGGVGKSVGGD